MTEIRIQDSLRATLGRLFPDLELSPEPCPLIVRSDGARTDAVLSSDFGFRISFGIRHSAFGFARQFNSTQYSG